MKTPPAPWACEDDEDDDLFSSSNQAPPPPFIETQDDEAWGYPLPAEVGPPPPDDYALMPGILARSLTETTTAGWNYHPRSDRHSNIKCIGLLLDLLRVCPPLVERLQSRRLVFGLNSLVEGKALDLVIGSPAAWKGSKPPRTLGDIVQQYDFRLSPEERGALEPFQDLQEGTIEAPTLAVEAKAVMTDHAGALPTLSDQLERFRLRVQEKAITAGLVLVNAADEFASPARNRNGHLHYNTHNQPADALRVGSVVASLPSRQNVSEQGFDALGVVFLQVRNDGSPINVVDLAPPEVAYGNMVRRLAALLTRSAS